MLRVWKYLGKISPLPAFKPSILGRAILDSMKTYPDDWSVDRHYAKHSPSSVEIWVANGTSFLKVEKAPNGLSGEQMSKWLSYGDRYAIIELANRIRDRNPDSTTIDKAAALFTKPV